MTVTPVVYRDDADAAVYWQVTDGDGQDVDWANPEIAVGDDAYISATWQGSPAPTRTIRLAMPLGLGLAAKSYTAYLRIPNGNDIALGLVTVADRT